MLNNNIRKTIISALLGTHNTFILHCYNFFCHLSNCPVYLSNVGLFEAYSYCDAQGVTSELLKHYYCDTYILLLELHDIKIFKG